MVNGYLIKYLGEWELHTTKASILWAKTVSDVIDLETKTWMLKDNKVMHYNNVVDENDLTVYMLQAKIW